MKIGIDIRCLMDNNYSGVGWYAFNLLDNLFKIDQQNEYRLFYNSSKAVKLPDWNYNNVSFVGQHYPNKLFNLSLNFFDRPFLDRLSGGVDVFFSPNLHFSSVSAKCRSIIAVHDLSFLIYPDFFTLKQRLWHQLILKKNILARAEVILADSWSTKNDLISLLKISEAKIKIIHLGVTENYFKEASAEELKRVREKYGLPEKYFLFLSTIEPRKNLAGVIKAFKEIKGNSSLVIAGNWGWKSAPIKKSFSQDQRIKFIDYIEEQDKALLYCGAIALVYPSFYEGFGLPILEAMASGCPVIAGNNSSQGEVLGDCGLSVDPFNVEEIRQAMEIILNDEILRQKFIDFGRIRAREFDWQKTARQVLEIFGQI